jgi:hypothetical protein
MSGDALDAVYARPSLDLMYGQSMRFVDASPELRQAFPGFPLHAPQFGE